MEDITDVDDFCLLDPSPDVPTYVFESMFGRICQQFNRDARKNTLIPSPSLYEAKQLLLLNVVTMKKKGNTLSPNVKEYSTYNISLANLLIGKPVLELQVEESKYCSHNSDNTYSSNRKFGRQIISMIGGNIAIFPNITITFKLGDLLERRIGYQSFMSALKDRKLDMNHHFIKEIKDANEVLCVIRNVITTSDKVEVKCKRNIGGYTYIIEKINRLFSLGQVIGAREFMVLEPRTTLAFDIWELRVDEDSGEMTPIMTKHNSGGFFKSDIRKIETYHYIKDIGEIEKYSLEKRHCIKDQKKIQSNVNRSDKPNEGDPHPPNDDEVEVAATLQYLQDILRPLRDCTEADRQPIKSSLLGLMTCYSDVVAISIILSKAEDGCLNEDKDTIDKQFINKDIVWSILKFVGVQTEEGRVLYEKEASPILFALVYMIDALLEIENEDFDIICRCDEPQLKTLSKIFESAVASSMPISIDVDMSSVLKEPVSSFLTHKKFTVCNDSIQPPKTKTCNVEYIFCVLYCLS